LLICIRIGPHGGPVIRIEASPIEEGKRGAERREKLEANLGYARMALYTIFRIVPG